MQEAAGAAPKAGQDNDVDTAVRRAIKNHFGSLSASEQAELRIQEESLFTFTRRHWMAKKKKSGPAVNLTSAWWNEIHGQIEGIPQWNDLRATDKTARVCPQLRAALDEIASPNPAARKMKKMDNFLRATNKPIAQHEAAEIFNQVADCNRWTCKFSCDSGVAVARHIAKFDLDTVLKEEVPPFVFLCF